MDGVRPWTRVAQVLAHYSGGSPVLCGALQADGQRLTRALAIIGILGRAHDLLFLPRMTGL